MAVSETARGARGRFVVLGFLRSGTTLLRRLLDAHPDISCPPETNLISGCGRFLEDSPTVDGLRIGALPGLAFSGVGAETVYAALREMVFGIEEEIAAGKPVWVEKTAADIFYLERIEPMLVGHCRFICVTRNPLDVIASVKDLCDGMDQFLPELLPFVRRHGSLFDAFAEAWIDRQMALDAFVDRHAAQCFSYRYEDLTADPAGALGRLLAFMGLEGDVDAILRAAFRGDAKVGLGDWKTYETGKVETGRAERWRESVPNSTAARLLPALSPLMRRHGYALPKLRAVATGGQAVRQYELSKQFIQNQASAET